MNTNFFARLTHTIMLVLLQALVLNNIHIYNIATPLLYIILPLKFSSSQPRWSALLWCFATGLLIDIFANTPGVAAGAMTLIGAVQPGMLKLFIQNDEEEHIKPSVKTLGWMKYITYTSLMSLTYCFVFFSLEAFSFFNPLLWIMSIGGSALLTTVILLVLERIKK